MAEEVELTQDQVMAMCREYMNDEHLPSSKKRMTSPPMSTRTSGASPASLTSSTRFKSPGFSPS